MRRTLYRELAGISALGRALDGYFVVLDDAARREPPPDQVHAQTDADASLLSAPWRPFVDIVREAFG